MILLSEERVIILSAIRYFNNSLISNGRLPSRTSCIASGTKPSVTWKYCEELRIESLVRPNAVGPERVEHWWL